MNQQACRVYARLDAMGIPYERHTHAPISSAADRFPMALTFDAQVCKNLLVTTRNESRFLLIMLPVEKEADLKALRAAVHCTRLGFANDAALLRLLGQQRGQVGVCGVIDDRAHQVEVVFDASLHGMARVAMHPGDNTETLVTAFEHIERFVRDAGNRVLFFDF